MSLRGICCVVLFLSIAGLGNAQRAESAKIISNAESKQTILRTADFAGTVNRIEFEGQSNSSVFPGPIYLCYNDQFQLIHNGDAVFCPDNDALTLPGVGYAFYSCRPLAGATGPQLNALLNDPCLANDPPVFNSPGFYTYRGSINGDALFWNDGYIQDFFYSGQPGNMWFAPITFDDFAGNFPVENGGSVNVNTSEAFEVVYLNAVQITNKIIGINGNDLAGSFQILGGISELDGTSYADIGIYKSGQPNIRGSVQGTNFSHNDVVNFTVPEPGEYVIYVEDEKSCGTSMEANFSDNNGSITINTSSFTDVQGGFQCVSFCVEDFVDINAMQFTVSFDPRYLTYNSLQNLDLFALSDGNFELSSVGNGVIRFVWTDPQSTGKTVVDGDCIFEICFDINADAPIGGCSNIAITGNVIPIAIEQQDANDISNTFTLDLNHTPGEACIDPGSDLSARISTCNSATSSFSGSLSFEIFGGTGPYSYQLLGAFNPTTGSGINAGEEVFVGNLAAGNGYQLVITDAAGTVIMLPVTIGDGNPLSVDLSGTDPSCFNFSNGEIIAAVSGGTAFPDGSYSYEWSNLIYNDDNIDRLTQGNYSVTVTDANGCEVIANEFIGTDPIDVVLDVSSLPTCVSSTNGIATATITGGTPNATGDYTVRWEGDIMATSFDQGNVVTNNQVQGGVIEITITDDNGCIWTENFDVEAEKELDLRFEFDQNILCAGDPNASFRVYGEFADGSPFELDGGNSPVEPSGTSKLNGPDHVFFPNLGAGIYDLTITDDLTGCATDTTFEILDPEVLIVNSSASYPCTSTSGGIIDLDITGGVAGYSFLWDDGSTEEDRDSLAEGMYQVTVTDSNGCTDVSDFEIMRSASATIDGIIVENIGCAGNTTGSLEAVVTTNGSNVTYNWEGPGGPYSTALIENLGPGTYSLTITDDQGCIDTEEREIAEGVDFTFMVSETQPSCTNSTDGSIAITVNEPGNYSYVWEHPNNTGSEVLSGISAGDYIVSISQEGGCTQIDTITLTSPAGIDIQLQSSLPTLCSYSNDGSATVIASGGVVDDGNYGFLWSSGEEDILSASTTSTATSLGAGEQFVVVVDALCFDTLFFNIDAPDSLVLDEAASSIVDISCFGLDDGSATIAATGGNGGYLYFWPDRNVDGPDIDNLTPGFERYVLADANGCLQLDSVFINEPDSLIVEIDPVNTIPLGCSNDQDGVIAVTVSGGDIQNPYSFQWTNDVSTTNTANALGPGEYDITVTDSNGCIDSTTYIIMAPEPITVDLPSPSEPTCFGDRTCIGIDDVFGGSGSGYRFSINNGPLNNIDSCIAVFAGVYDIAVFDNTGCSFDTTLTIEQPEELVLDLGPDIEVDLGDSSTIIDVFVEGPNNIDGLIWEPNSDFGCLNDDCSRIAIFPNVTTLYTVDVIDEAGCTAQDELLVEVIKIVRAYFPTAFSPNGDGFNDIFSAFTGRGIQSIDEFAVFDRWGNEMYKIRNLSPNNGGTEGWDGRLNGVDVDSGVYTYYARVTLIDQEEVMLRGDVTLLR